MRVGKTRKPASAVMSAIHSTASGLHRMGLMPAETMREFDALCLTPVESFSAEAIKQLRLSTGMSQGVFAAYLNVGGKTISKWESGETQPDGPSLKLLNLVKRKGVKILA